MHRGEVPIYIEEKMASLTWVNYSSGVEVRCEYIMRKIMRNK